MKKVLITQRVDINDVYGERRDALDQKWIDFLLSINVFPVILPNNIDYVKQLVEEELFDGVLLTGGNSLVSCGGDAPEREEIENFLLSMAINKNIPVIGVCRGMQVIQEFFNNNLIRISGHTATRFILKVKEKSRFGCLISNIKDVNAYHDYGAFEAQGELLPVAYSSDGVVMALEHCIKPVFGVMWHSERESSFRYEEQELFREIFSNSLKA